MEDPLFDARCNIMGSIVLIDLSARADVERFIFASTGGAMYGEPARFPVSENTPPKPLTQILAGETCIIYGEGKQTRDYVYVEDVSRANLLALDCPPGTYNIGTGIETSVLALVRLLRETSGKNVSISYSPPRAGEVARIALSCKHAENNLHWRAQVSLTEGITRTFRWFAERR